jgi:hypothetical protein
MLDAFKRAGRSSYGSRHMSMFLSKHSPSSAVSSSFPYPLNKKNLILIFFFFFFFFNKFLLIFLFIHSFQKAL